MLHVHGCRKQVGRMGNCPPSFWWNGKEDRNKNILIFAHPEFSCFRHLWGLTGCRYTVWSVNDVQLETPWIPAAVGLRQDKPIQFFFWNPLHLFCIFQNLILPLLLDFMRNLNLVSKIFLNDSRYIPFWKFRGPQGVDIYWYPKNNGCIYGRVTSCNM